MRRALGPALIAVLAAAVSLASARLPQTDPNAFFALFALEPLGILAGGFVAHAVLVRQPARALSLLGVALYLTLLGVAFVTLFPFWLPEDDTILGTALVGGLLVAVGAALARSSALILTQRRLREAVSAGASLGVLACLGVHAQPLLC